ncbi:TorF family putative porin [Xanthomonas albilineans]|uniref:TorF family putative porin n=1 Tax=Xanthomonas albilineans TaxID=29447 RepID=UPI0005F34D87|nr:TorF family putative porin [Xanthomonas albilineans]PPU94213.1 hypothetical protein XalbCFBP2523_03745 [Xanthomonas albilineans]
MSTMIRSMAAMALSVAVPAWAASTTANLSVTSNYVSRGFEQSWGKPVVQGGLDVVGDSGWYAGTWASGVSPYFIEGGHTEWDVYAGYAASRGDWGWRSGVYYYAYPGALITVSGTHYDYGELIVATHWRTVELSYASTWTRDYVGYNGASLGIDGGQHSRGSGYLALDATYEVAPAWQASVHAGHQHIRNFADYGWTDARVGLSHTWRGTEFGLAYARAWSGADLYRHYSTGVPDGSGRIHVSNPIDGAWTFTIKRNFKL